MKKCNLILSFIKHATIVIFFMFTGQANALKAPPPVEITILTVGLGQEGGKFPDEIIRFWDVISINQEANSVEIAPIIKLIRIDSKEEKEFIFPKNESWVDSMVKPDPRIALKKAHDFLEQAKLTKDFSDEMPSDNAQKEARKNKYFSEIGNVFVVSKAEATAKNQFNSGSDLIAALNQQIGQDISTGNNLKYLIFYNLDKSTEKRTVLPIPVTQDEAIKTESGLMTSSLEAQQHVKQAMMFVSLAKANPTTRSENIKNALAEFDVAVKQEESNGRCFAIAFMNRGIAYWLDKKLNLAEKDLIKASECDKQNPIIFYNLASYYSAVNKADLALDPLNKALDLGFKDCDILRKDSDLKKLRKMNEFRRILEQHSLFCLK